MATIQMVLTNAGRAAIVNNVAGGLGPVVIKYLAVGDGYASPTASRTALVREIKQISNAAGGASGTYMVHVNSVDSSNDTYTATEIGLILDDGTLFAYYSTAVGTPLIEKASGATSLVSVDVWVDGLATPATVTVGDTNFVLNNATDTMRGLVELATNAETMIGSNPTTAVTPAGLSYVLNSINAVQRVNSGGAQPSAPYNTNTATVWGEGNFWQLRTYNVLNASSAPGVITFGSTTALGDRLFVEHTTSAGTVTLGTFPSEARIATLYPYSSQAQAQAGTLTASIMSPARVKDAIDFQRPWASQSQAESGTSTAAVMSPSRTYDAIQAFRPFASPSEATTGTSLITVMSPARTLAAVNSWRPTSTNAAAQAGTGAGYLTSPQVKLAIDAQRPTMSGTATNVWSRKDTFGFFEVHMRYTVSLTTSNTGFAITIPFSATYGFARATVESISPGGSSDVQVSTCGVAGASVSLVARVGSGTANVTFYITVVGKE